MAMRIIAIQIGSNIIATVNINSHTPTLTKQLEYLK